MANKWVNLSTEERELLIEALDTWSAGSGDKAASRLISKLEKAGNRKAISSAKGKGRGLQMWVCGRIAGLLGTTFDQSDDQCEIHSREMGQHGNDIILRGSAFKKLPISFECKSQENLNMTDSVQQAKDNLGKAKAWVLVHRRKTIPDTLVTMTWDTMEQFYRQEIGE